MPPCATTMSRAINSVCPSPTPAPAARRAPAAAPPTRALRPRDTASPSCRRVRPQPRVPAWTSAYSTPARAARARRGRTPARRGQDRLRPPPPRRRPRLDRSPPRRSPPPRDPDRPHDGPGKRGQPHAPGRVAAGARLDRFAHAKKRGGIILPVAPRAGATGPQRRVGCSAVITRQGLTRSRESGPAGSRPTRSASAPVPTRISRSGSRPRSSHVRSIAAAPSGQTGLLALAAACGRIDPADPGRLLETALAGEDPPDRLGLAGSARHTGTDDGRRIRPHPQLPGQIGPFDRFASGRNKGPLDPLAQFPQTPPINGPRQTRRRPPAQTRRFSFHAGRRKPVGPPGPGLANALGFAFRPQAQALGPDLDRQLTDFIGESVPPRPPPPCQTCPQPHRQTRPSRGRTFALEQCPHERRAAHEDERAVAPGAAPVVFRGQMLCPGRSGPEWACSPTTRPL